MLIPRLPLLPATVVNAASSIADFWLTASFFHLRPSVARRLAADVSFDKCHKLTRAKTASI
jgi:hypothetical protein